MVNKSITGSHLCQLVADRRYVSSIENWETVPGNWMGFMKKQSAGIRRVKDPRLLEYWDMRMRMKRHRLAFGTEFRHG